MSLKSSLLLIAAALITQIAAAQSDQHKQQVPEWVQLMHQSNPDIGAVVEAHDAYYKTHNFKKNTYTQEYKRWLHSIRLDYTGTALGAPMSAATAQNLSNYIQQSNQLRLSKSPTSAWQCVGPFDFDKESVSKSYAAGAAHVYTVEQSLSNPNIVYAGSANGGLWKSIDKGLHWTGLTLFMPVNEVYAIEIDHANANIMYFSDGSKIYKTTDGGVTFAPTGDATFQSTAHFCRDLIMAPNNSNKLLAATDQGLFRTTDAGLTWTLVQSGVWQEVEWNTADSTIVYAIYQVGNKTAFYKSTDGGLTFSIRTNGWPVPAASDENKRTEIAVTPAAPSIIYAFATGVANGGSGLYGIYVSHNYGESWTFNCCGTGPGGVPNATTNPNLCAWADDGSDDGGQYYYDLSLAVSPIDSNKVHVGAVNHWISTDGGINFTCPSKWSHSGKVNYVHADIHDIKYFGNDLWMACDGGVFYSHTFGDTIDRRMLGIAGTDFWGFATGWWDGSQVMIGGAYHNGTMLKDNAVYNNGWLCMNGGDGELGAVNYGNNRDVYTDYGRHLLSGNRLIDKVNLAMGMLPSTSYIVGEDAELEFDPNVYHTLYIGHDSSLWKSTDDGANFSLVHFFPQGKVTSIEVASNRQTIYVAIYPGWWSNKKVMRSTDGGANWTDITPSTALQNSNLWAPFDMAVGDNPQDIWLVRCPQSSTYNNLNGNKVFRSTDGGTTWTNYTTATLNGEYITNIVYQKGSNGGVYMGSRRGVYYRNNTLSDWQLFNNNLPTITSSTQLVIDYKNSKIVNGTNRSVYVCDLYENNFAPIANPAVDKEHSSCLRDTFYFSDHSAMQGTGATWNWSFPGGTPFSSSLRNPKVTYSSSGTKSVSLTVTDANGTSSKTLTNFIQIANNCQADTIPGSCISLNGTDATVTVPPLNLNSNTVTLSAWIKPSANQHDWAGIVFSRSGSTTAGISIKSNNEIRYHWNGNNWSWNSGLFAVTNQWNYVALVITPTAATIYVNGMAATNTTAHSTEAFDGSTKIGVDDNGGGRYFTGLIDEVCIYNRALSINEIRTQMHLTKNPSLDNSLLAYYQFNEVGADVLDKANLYHASSSASAIKVRSRGPFGGGNAALKNCTAAGPILFDNTGAELDFTANNPNGDVVLTRINLAPDTLPNAANHSRAYWIFDNYGSNTSFSALNSIRLNKTGPVSTADAANPALFQLYQRQSNDDLFTWGVKKDNADVCVAGTDGAVTFNTGNSITSGGQFVIMNEGGSSFNGMSFTASSTADIRVYPSLLAAGDPFTVHCVEPGNSTITLFDVDGKVRLQETTTSTSAVVETIGLNAGTYFYRIKTATHMQFGKLIIQ